MRRLVKNEFWSWLLSTTQQRNEKFGKSPEIVGQGFEAKRTYKYELKNREASVANLTTVQNSQTLKLKHWTISRRRMRVSGTHSDFCRFTDGSSSSECSLEALQDSPGRIHASTNINFVCLDIILYCKSKLLVSETLSVQSSSHLWSPGPPSGHWHLHRL